MPGLRQGRHPVDPGRHPALLREMRVRGPDVDADRMTTPIARTTDPWTSHAGAAEVTDSGRRPHQGRGPASPAIERDVFRDQPDGDLAAIQALDPVHPGGHLRPDQPVAGDIAL